MPVTISSVDFRNFKAFSHFQASLQHMNVLVGPNNCGKSTLISAFRCLATGIRRARAKSPELVVGPNGPTFGYRLSKDTLPISVENVHTDYTEKDSLVTFRLSNGNRLELLFPREGSCLFIPQATGRAIRTPSNFRSAFPITIGVVPVLGPVEHEEEILQKETVQNNLATHRASRHFRNYWYHFPDGFDEFAALVRRTWPGMEIEKPFRADYMSNRLGMFCREDRMTRELYWAGFGFQIWCQLLTHISRARGDCALVIDEPEIYLHPDVQRQLLSILRDAGPDIVIATHSTEIMAEADPSEILVIEKAKRSAQRLRDVKGVQVAIDTIGSIQNITLTQLARHRKALFVEGLHDFKLLRRFASRMGLDGLAAGVEITAIESGGFTSWERINATAWGIEKATGQTFSIGAVFDRDYFCAEEATAILDELKPNLSLVWIHLRKEIENYLLTPNVLQRALARALHERAKRTGSRAKVPQPIDEILEGITSPMRDEVQGQYIAKRSTYLRHSRIDEATIVSDTIRYFDSKWTSISTRMEVVPGKTVLAALRNMLQETYQVNLTDVRIIDEYHADEIPGDLCELLQNLDAFRRGHGPDQQQQQQDTAPVVSSNAY